VKEHSIIALPRDRARRRAETPRDRGVRSRTGFGNFVSACGVFDDMPKLRRGEILCEWPGRTDHGSTAVCRSCDFGSMDSDSDALPRDAWAGVVSAAR
jgi:hypothetical protein